MSYKSPVGQNTIERLVNWHFEYDFRPNAVRLRHNAVRGNLMQFIMHGIVQQGFPLSGFMIARRMALVASIGSRASVLSFLHRRCA
jgi:hypothetical protein